MLIMEMMCGGRGKAWELSALDLSQKAEKRYMGTLCTFSCIFL